MLYNTSASSNISTAFPSARVEGVNVWIFSNNGFALVTIANSWLIFPTALKIVPAKLVVAKIAPTVTIPFVTKYPVNKKMEI